MLYDWLQETGELYMDLDRPHSGGSNGSVYFFGSLSELKGIVSQEAWREVNISVFRAKQYPIRGIFDARLLAVALAQIPDVQYFSILSGADSALRPCEVIGWGDSHEELREEFARLEGRQVRIGQNPYDLHDDQRFFDSPEEVFVVRFLKRGGASKNRAGYAPFDASPERYRLHIESW
jgi:hypothetical protein